MARNKSFLFIEIPLLGKVAAQPLTDPAERYIDRIFSQPITVSNGFDGFGKEISSDEQVLFPLGQGCNKLIDHFPQFFGIRLPFHIRFVRDAFCQFIQHQMDISAAAFEGIPGSVFIKR